MGKKWDVENMKNIVFESANTLAKHNNKWAKENQKTLKILDGKFYIWGSKNGKNKKLQKRTKKR